MWVVESIRAIDEHEIPCIFSKLEDAMVFCELDSRNAESHGWGIIGIEGWIITEEGWYEGDCLVSEVGSKGMHWYIVRFLEPDSRLAGYSEDDTGQHYRKVRRAIEELQK